MADFGDGNPLDAFGLQQDAGALPALQDPEDLLQAAEPQQPAQPGSGPQTDIEDAEIYQALNSGNIPPHWPTTSGPGVTFLVLPPGQEPELAAGEKAERSGNPTVAYRSSNSRRLLLKEYTSLQYVGTRDPTGRTLHRLFIAEVEREAGREERRRDLQPGMLLADGRRGARYICREVHGVPSVWKLRPSRGRQGRPAEGPAQPEQPMQRQRAYQGAHNEPRQPQQVPQQPQQQQQQQMQQTPQVLQPQQQQQQQPPPQPQQQHSPAMEQLLSALFPPSITPSSTPVDLLPLADQLSYVLHQLHPDTSAILDTQLVASDGSCVCLGHLAVAPSRAAAEGGLAEGSATMPELWSLMVLATLREILRPVGAIGFESLLCKTNSSGNTLHWSCRYQRLSVIEWLLGHPPSGLPASLPHEWQELLQRPRQPSIALLVRRSLKSGWLPLHSLLREAGEKQQQLPQLQAEERAAAQLTFDRLLQLCQCWILAVEACMGRAYTQQRLEHLTSRPYIHFGCGALLSRVCSELGYEPCQPRSRGQLVMEVEELQARMAILGH